MAPRFSVSWLGLEDPRSTELTPSFLRHQAEDQRKEKSQTCNEVSKKMDFERHIFALTKNKSLGRRSLLPMASCGKVHPSFSAIWASSFSLACCFLPSSLTIFSLNHWYGYRNNENRCVRLTCKDMQVIIQFLSREDPNYYPSGLH